MIAGLFRYYLYTNNSCWTTGTAAEVEAIGFDVLTDTASSTNKMTYSTSLYPTTYAVNFDMFNLAYFKILQILRTIYLVSLVCEVMPVASFPQVQLVQWEVSSVKHQ